MSEDNCETATCYNSAYLTSSSSDCGDDDASLSTEVLTLTGVAIGGIFIGMLLMWLSMRYFVCLSEKKKELKSDNVYLNDDLLEKTY